MSRSMLPASLEMLKIRAEVASALGTSGWSSSSARNAALASLRTALSLFREEAFSRLSGGSGGAAAAQTLAQGVKACLRVLFESMASADPDGSAGVALCAQGGFGAGDLAPASDVDLMLIRPDGAGEATDAFLQQFLYALWDLKIDVGGGACRSIDETIALARTDASERTSLLSIRHIAGDPDATRRLETRFREEVVEGDAAAFVEAKLKERDARIEKAGRSRYTVEPNIKSGKGGLRDLQLMRWLAQFLYGNDAIERWVAGRLLSVDDVTRYVNADDFLWTVRFHLHDIAGGKNEMLTFDLQPEIARRMGFEDGETESAVERFMRRYFMTAMAVGSLTRLVCARLEADAWKSKPKNLARFLPGEAPETAADLEDFIVHDGRLDFAHPTQIADDPVHLIRFFHVASSRRMDLHPEAFARIRRTLHFVDDDFRSDPRAARAFFAVLLDSPTPMAVLRLMTEAGLLGRYIPEFGDIVARTQFNMYHRYTVDEHTLQAISLLREIEQGLHTDDHPLVTKIASKVKNRRALHLAVLLHDTGKGAGDQCIEGGKRARTACARLGLDEAETELVAWLIENHLLMSDTAQRRDLGDPQTIADFADAVGSRERLHLLALLTVVDIRAVGPGVWNAWKGQLIRELYAATKPVLAGDGDNMALARQAQADRADAARSKVIARLQRLDPAFAQDWGRRFHDDYWVGLGDEDLYRHAAFGRSVRARGLETAVGMRVDKRRAASEVMIWARDRNRLFADIAAALAEMGADIVGAAIHTTHDGFVFDIFHIQDAGRQAFGQNNPHARDAILDYLRGVIDGDLVVEHRHPLTPKARDAAFEVSPTVSVSNDLAERSTVIEASGRDRPGLLADLASAIADGGLDLEAARIDGYGERATDVFYVTHNNSKLDDHALIESVTSELLDVLSDGENALEARAAKRGFARARASVLR